MCVCVKNGASLVVLSVVTLARRPSPSGAWLSAGLGARRQHPGVRTKMIMTELESDKQVPCFMRFPLHWFVASCGDGEELLWCPVHGLGDSGLLKVEEKNSVGTVRVLT